MKFFLFGCLLLLSPIPAFAGDPLTPQPYVPESPRATSVWVAPNGSDVAGTGSRTKPFLTPARASEVGRDVLLLPGHYRSFGEIIRGGTAREPLRIRAASSTETTFFLQDAAQPAAIKTNHVLFEGFMISGAELERPGACIAITTDVQDVSFAHLRLTSCAQGIAAGRFAWTHATLRDLTISDMKEAGIACGNASCQNHRLERVQLHRIGTSEISGMGATYGNRSRMISWRNVQLHDIDGDGARFEGPRPSIANSVFSEIRGTALTLERGGYMARTEIATERVGLKARVGTDLVIERSLVYARTPTARTLELLPDHPQDTGTFLLAWTRLEFPTSTHLFDYPQNTHTTHILSSVLWGEEDVIARLRTENIEWEEDSQLLAQAPHEDDLFSPVFSGGETFHNTGGTRTITAGSQIRGTTNEALYALGEDNALHLIATSSLQKRWYPFPVEINTISDASLDSLERGDDMSEPPGTLVKSVGRPHVYVVTAPNSLRWLASEELALAYAGPRWTRMIIELERETLTQYEEREPILTRDAFEESELLRPIMSPGDLFDEG